MFMATNCSYSPSVKFSLTCGCSVGNCCAIPKKAKLRTNNNENENTFYTFDLDISEVNLDFTLIE